jgi:multicomponent Na+:H+ antiporter subunit D
MSLVPLMHFAGDYISPVCFLGAHVRLLDLPHLAPQEPGIDPAGFRYFLFHTLGGLFLLAGLLLRYKAVGNSF